VGNSASGRAWSHGTSQQACKRGEQAAMVVQHLMGLSPITAITAVITSAGVAGFRTWTWLRRSAVAEHARTLRLVTVLRCAPGENHAEVVRALAELEAAIGGAASSGGRTAPPRRQGRARGA
jgi:hypothetical protein